MTHPRIAMQVTCLSCGREQWAAAVYSVSRGEHPCVFCHAMSKPMTPEQYLKLKEEER